MNQPSSACSTLLNDVSLPTAQVPFNVQVAPHPEPLSDWDHLDAHPPSPKASNGMQLDHMDIDNWQHAPRWPRLADPIWLWYNTPWEPGKFSRSILVLSSWDDIHGSVLLGQIWQVAQRQYILSIHITEKLADHVMVIVLSPKHGCD